MEKPITTTIRVPEVIWRLLRNLAEQRAIEEGGRPSASAVICELVEAEQKRTEGDRVE